MQFTKEDRDFIIKIAKSLDDYKKSTDQRLDILEGKDKEVLSPIQPVQEKHTVINERFRRDIPFGELEEGDSIQLTFKNGETDQMKQKVLIESLYMTLKKLCEDNNIEQLFIRIED